MCEKIKTYYENSKILKSITIKYNNAEVQKHYSYDNIELLRTELVFINGMFYGIQKYYCDEFENISVLDHVSTYKYFKSGGLFHGIELDIKY